MTISSWPIHTRLRNPSLCLGPNTVGHVLLACCKNAGNDEVAQEHRATSVSDRPIVRPALSQGLLCHGDKDAALITLHQEGYGVLVVSLSDSVAYLLHRLYCLAVDLTNDIATLQASALRRTAWLDTDDHDTGCFWQAALTGHCRCDILELQPPLARCCLTGRLTGSGLCRQFAN